MKALLSLVSILFLFTFVDAQVKYNSQLLPPLEKSATIVFSEVEKDLAPNWHVVEAPQPSGDSYAFYLANLKKDIDKLYPKTNAQGSNSRSVAEAPVVTRALWGNTSTAGTPLDNHIAVSRDEQIVTVINSDITVKNSAGVTRSSMSLEAFTESIGNFGNVFDPRINYDPLADKFYMAILQGNNSANTNILFAFTETNDATGKWHLYKLPGNPFDDGTWSDYPMITFTDTEYFLTMNSIRDNEPWETGFAQTLIYQFNKDEAFLGMPLQMKMWNGVELDGRNIRNLHPVKSATGEPGDNVYFLSNRNFDMENDSIFVLELNGRHDDPNTVLDIQVYKSDVPYRTPPNATQSIGFLQTNDARVLDSYLLGDKIQFVGNTLDPANGRCGIYHGTIHDITGDRSITGQIISEPNQDLGYPSMAYTGVDEGDTDAIIIFSHTAIDRNAGYSAMYFDNDGSYSPLVTVKEGTSRIDMLNSDVDRWGDYSGNQRNYAEPGEVWVSSSYGGASRRNGTWLGEIIRPDLFVSQDQVQSNVETQTFPNPTADRFNVIIDAFDAKHMHLYLTNIHGKLIHTFINNEPKRKGKIEFSFATNDLASGTYFLHIEINGVVQKTEKLIVVKNK